MVIFMVKYVTKIFKENSNLKRHKFSKEFTTLKVTTFEWEEIPLINMYIFGKSYISKLQPNWCFFF
jgi:hypothetical protein